MYGAAMHTRRWSSTASKPAVFSVLLGEQVAAFQRDGFVLVRKDEGARAVNTCVVATEVAAMLDKQQSTWKYMLWRAFNSVKTNKNRRGAS